MSDYWPADLVLKVENMLKNLIFVLSIALLATSCSSLRPSASRPVNNTSSGNTGNNSNGSIQFINDISIRPDGSKVKTGASMVTSGSGNSSSDLSSGSSADVEKSSALKFKYAILEDASVEDLENEKLLSFMDDWYGTRYHYGGTTKSGIDCSAFACSLFTTVYGITGLPRTSKEQYDATRRVSRDELQEGDLVFFHTLGKHRTVTHVGVYLRNNKFIHASISGVMISDMNDGYYDKHYVGAGRIIPGS
jgi:cell wall-associated NlpC family hydrolase